jgi:hypothetical protein
MKSPVVLIQSLFLFITLSVPVAAEEPMNTASPAGAKAYIISPQDGETVDGTFKVVFGLYGMGVAPAGISRENTGHHHLLINVDELPDLSKPLPATDQVKHFGAGQTETELTLEPGRHTLQLLLGNHAHVPHHPPVMSRKITVIVESAG